MNETGRQTQEWHRASSQFSKQKTVFRLMALLLKLSQSDVKLYEKDERKSEIQCHQKLMS